MAILNKDDICIYEIITFEYPVYRLVISTLYSAAALATTVLNLLILISTWKTPSLHKPSYILVANLALSDLIIGGIGEPLMVVKNLAGLKGWSLQMSCEVSKSARGVLYAMAGVSLITLTAISIDRLLAIRLRNRYRSVVTLKRVFLILLFWWVAICLTSLSVFATLESLPLFILVLFSGIFVFISLTTIIVSYVMAFYSLNRITGSVSPVAQDEEASTASISGNIDIKKYRKSLKTMVLVCLVTIVFSIPFSFASLALVISLVKVKGLGNFDVFYMVYAAAELILMTNSTMNPLLYLWRMQDIRGAVKATVRIILRREHQ